MSPEQITALFAERGLLSYEGECITQLQHAWQCARLARQARATPALELAAWLHDLGHLMTGLEGSPTQRGIDDTHESLAAQALSSLLGAAVAEPVALHVRAKRYLVAAQPSYARALSHDSVRSLALQGGPMAPAECKAFLALPYAQDALRLRVWDDNAKEPNLHADNAARALAELSAAMQAVIKEQRVQGPPAANQQGVPAVQNAWRMPNS
jgi:phosphonate degradation associated HDIG domain protein